MRIDKRGKRERVIIDPGEFHVSNNNVVISTLLGSCVSVCLYDPFAKIIGMNHFLLSNRRYARDMPTCESEAGRYGIHAMEMIINEMLKRGAKRKNLHAKAFGGGMVLKPSAEAGNFFCVGDVNCRFVREFLRNDGIRLVTEDLGGEDGRVIHFSAVDYAVYVRKIKKIFSSKLAQRDKKFWKKTIQEQEKAKTEADIWL